MRHAKGRADRCAITGARLTTTQTGTAWEPRTHVKCKCILADGTADWACSCREILNAGEPPNSRGAPIAGKHIRPQNSQHTPARIVTIALNINNTSIGPAAICRSGHHRLEKYIRGIIDYSGSSFENRAHIIRRKLRETTVICPRRSQPHRPKSNTTRIAWRAPALHRNGQSHIVDTSVLYRKKRETRAVVRTTACSAAHQCSAVRAQDKPLVGSIRPKLAVWGSAHPKVTKERRAIGARKERGDAMGGRQGEKKRGALKFDLSLQNLIASRRGAGTLTTTPGGFLFHFLFRYCNTGIVCGPYGGRQFLARLPLCYFAITIAFGSLHVLIRVFL